MEMKFIEKHFFSPVCVNVEVNYLSRERETGHQIYLKR